jgi:hypothetical protein
MNVAFKIIQIMGQIIRNFPGSLRGDTKLAIVRESYLLGLRTLNAALSIIKVNAPEVKNYLRALLQKHRSIQEGPDLDKRTEKMFVALNVALAYSTIKRVSYSVGNEQLRQTFEDVLSVTPGPAISLMDLAIKLEHLRPFPEAEIMKLDHGLRGNDFADVILKRLVFEHFYFFPSDYKIRQRVCDKLKIRIAPKLVGNSTKDTTN